MYSVLYWNKTKLFISTINVCWTHAKQFHIGNIIDSVLFSVTNSFRVPVILFYGNEFLLTIFFFLPHFTQDKKNYIYIYFVTVLYSCLGVSDYTPVFPCMLVILSCMWTICICQKFFDIKLVKLCVWLQFENRTTERNFQLKRKKQITNQLRKWLQW